MCSAHSACTRSLATERVCFCVEWHSATTRRTCSSSPAPSTVSFVCAVHGDLCVCGPRCPHVSLLSVGLCCMAQHLTGQRGACVHELCLTYAVDSVVVDGVPAHPAHLHILGRAFGTSAHPLARIRHICTSLVVHSAHLHILGRERIPL